NVFLDTEVFDAHQLDFTSPNLRRLVRLTGAGTVHLFLTTVTRGEVLAHLDEKAQEAFKHVKEFRRSPRIMRKVLPPEAMAAIEAVTKEAACVALRKEFDDFVASSKATILPVDKVCPEAVFKKFFEGSAPFGDGRKKHEFPDAFACGAIQGWSAA